MQCRFQFLSLQSILLNERVGFLERHKVHLELACVYAVLRFKRFDEIDTEIAVAVVDENRFHV
jgi:hypothetical protein